MHSANSSKENISSGNPRSPRVRFQIILILAMLALIVAGIFFIRYEAKHQIAGLSRKPQLTLSGDSTVILYPGDKFQDRGYEAKSFTGKDLTSQVKTSASLDNFREDGTMWLATNGKIKYTITDGGNIVTKTRTIQTKYHKQNKDSKTYGHGIAVCMFHNVYDPENPPTDLNTNFISTDDLEAILKRLIRDDYYFPTWQELRDYIDGKIELPTKSVVLTFDDCAKGFQQYGIPLLEKYNVRATSFVICAKNGKEVLKKFKDVKHINFQSHSYNMHRPGGNIGHGGIFPALTQEEGVEDLKKSIEMLGSGEAFAYPFGDYTETCEAAVKEAGFLCAFTTEYGMVHPGDDPYLLSRIRINGGTAVDDFIKAITESSDSESDS